MFRYGCGATDSSIPDELSSNEDALEFKKKKVMEKKMSSCSNESEND